MDINFLWAGGIIAAVSATWGQLKALGSQFMSLFVVTIIVNEPLPGVITAYVQAQSTPTRTGTRSYVARWLRVKQTERVQLVAWRIVDKDGALFFYRRWPLWVCPVTGKDSLFADSPSFLRIRFVRGTVDPDRFVSDAVRFFNRVHDDAEKNNRRHFIRRIYGLSKKRAMSQSNKDSGGVPPSVAGSRNVEDLRSMFPVDHTYEDIQMFDSRSCIETLALSPSATEAIEEARRWKKSEQWYKGKGLSWRRGWLLYGRPGNGKTALARALAEELDLPVFIFDLASLANDEFQCAWQEMLSYAPCLALVEDVDAVFDHRETLSGDLTFDCFLNCLDGIERADGLFTIITTNKGEGLDAALGVADPDGRSSRPGRVDRAIFMSDPDDAGRLKIAQRVLHEHPERWDKVVAEGEGETGAQFQERCAALALRLYWNR